MKWEVPEMPVYSAAAFETLDRDTCIDQWRRTIGGQSLKYVSAQFMRSALAYQAQIGAIQRQFERLSKRL